MNKHLRSGLLLAVAFGIVALKLSEASSAAILQSQDDAFRQGGFAAAAAVAGTFEKTVNAGDEEGPQTVQELVRGSQVVLVGLVVSNRGVLSPRGDSIRTHYQIQPIKVLKGYDLVRDRGASLIVSVLGGRVGFGNHSWAQLNVRYSDPPVNGQDYLFFLNPVDPSFIVGGKAVDTQDAEFWTLHGPSGIFGLGASGTELRPADRKHSRRAVVRDARGDGGALVRSVEAELRRAQ